MSDFLKVVSEMWRGLPSDGGCEAAAVNALLGPDHAEVEEIRKPKKPIGRNTMQHTQFKQSSQTRLVVGRWLIPRLVFPKDVRCTVARSRIHMAYSRLISRARQRGDWTYPETKNSSGRVRDGLIKPV
jgi:hypothetical protein